MTSMKREDTFPIVVEHNNEGLNDIIRKSPRTKYVIIGVSVIAITLIVTFGLVGAMFALKDTADKAITSHHLSIQSGNDAIDETIEEYPRDVTQYTVDSPEGRFIVVDDLSRRLKVLSDGKICAVAPLTGKDENEHDSNSEDIISEGTPKEEVSVKLIHQTIREHKVLGRHAQSLCTGLPLYWAEIVSTCPSEEVGRQRRGGCVRICAYSRRCRCQVCYNRCW